MKRTAFCLTLAMMASTAFAQTETKPPEEPPSFYRLDFVVKELDAGKLVNSRAYSMSISNARNSQNASIRTGSRVPITTGEGKNTYLEIGINFDCRAARQVGSELALYVSAEVSSVPEPASNPPLVRNNRWSGDVIVPLRKSTTVFTSDDAMSKRQMQLELTATPITPR